MDFVPFPDTENGDAEVPLTGSCESCYAPEVALLAGVAKFAYAADSKREFCSFCPLRNSSQQSETTKENHLDVLPPLAGLLATF